MITYLPLEYRAALWLHLTPLDPINLFIGLI
jgi:hypothetical protein